MRFNQYTQNKKVEIYTKTVLYLFFFLSVCLNKCFSCIFFTLFCIKLGKKLYIYTRKLKAPVVREVRLHIYELAFTNALIDT